MTNIIFQQIDFGGTQLGFYVDNKTGECYTTSRTLATLCGVSHTAIQKQGGNLKPIENAEVLSMSGLQGGNLISEDDSFNMIEYYSFDAGRYCTQTASKNYRAMARFGYRKFIHELVGFTPIKRMTYTQRLDEMDSRLAKPNPLTWTVIEMTQDLLREVDQVYPVNKFDLLDGSVGRCWSHYRSNVLELEDTEHYAMLKVNSSPYPVKIKAYDNSEWESYKKWLHEIYRAYKLNPYLKKKYGAIIKID